MKCSIMSDVRDIRVEKPHSHQRVPSNDQDRAMVTLLATQQTATVVTVKPGPLDNIWLRFSSSDGKGKKWTPRELGAFIGK